MELLYLIKEFLGIKETQKVVKPQDTRCVCELNRDGELISGWCHKHHTDWL